ncbi:MAG TPA: amidase [Acidimicrobiales bacterium]|nr:amidase [Acidimicrobiales bacterium]
MTLLDEVQGADATGFAEAIRRGDLDPVEAVTEAVERTREAHERFNCLSADLGDEAVDAARRSDRSGPFACVPFLLKDLGATQAGMPFTMGNRVLRNAGYRSPADTPLGQRLRASGLIAVGRGATSELGLQTTTQPLANGPTRNPWAPERSPGGSSGGSAVAVAVGAVPFAHGNDLAGSLRIPAAWCGVYGLKPSRGRMPLPSDFVDPYAVEFGLARSVRDMGGLLDALAGAVPGQLYHPAATPPSFIEAVTRPPHTLRIGVLEAGPIAPSCAAAVDRTVEALRHAGHRLDVVAGVFEGAPLDALRTLARVGARARMARIAQALGRELGEADVEPYTWALAAPTEPVGAEAYEAARTRVHVWGAAVIERQGDIDILLTPTVPEPAVPLADYDPPPGDPLAVTRLVARHIAFTQPFNVTGQPALSMPAGRDATGLPVGVQLVGPPGREDLLLSLAASIEGAL